MEPRITILYADADDARRDELRGRFSESRRFGLFTVDSIEEAEHELRTRAIDAVITEHEFPDGDWREVAALTRAISPETALFLYTGAPRPEPDAEDHPDPVIEYHDRSVMDPADLADAVETAVRYRTQRPYPVPRDEARRLQAQAQYDTADPDLRRMFDRLAALAAEVFDVAGAFVGIIGTDAERFVGRCGLDIDRLDRSDAICTYGLLSGGITTVEDIPADPRFADNEKLAEFGFRSYAGAPLITPDGATIGMFCLYDTRPRTYSPTERDHLRGFADVAVEGLELARRLAAPAGG